MQRMLIALAASCILLSSCSRTIHRTSKSQNPSAPVQGLLSSRTDHQTPHDGYWLDEDRLELAVRKELQIVSKSEQARLDHVRHLLASQQQADILLELCDPEQMQMLNS